VTPDRDKSSSHKVKVIAPECHKGRCEGIDVKMTDCWVDTTFSGDCSNTTTNRRPHTTRMGRWRSCSSSS